MRTAIHAARCLFITALLARFALSADESSTAKVPDTKSLSGQVLDESGNPVKGALVRVPTGKEDVKHLATTGADGRFKLILPSDFRIYRLACIATADRGDRQGFYRPDATVLRFPTSISIVLKPAREIRASVVDGSGAPVPAADVQVFSRLVSVAHSVTGASGQTFLKIPTGLTLNEITAVKSGTGFDYFAFQPPPPISKRPGLLAQDVDSPIEFKLTGARKVTIAVTDKRGKPIEGVRLHIDSMKLPGKGWRFFGDDLIGQVQHTGPDGTAAFDFIPVNVEQRIRISASKPSTHQPQEYEFEPESFVDRVQVEMPALIAVRGRVLDAAGQPVVMAQVAAVGANYNSSEDYRTSAKSDADGNFKLMLATNRFYQVVARKDRNISTGVAFILKQQPIDDLEMKLTPATRIYGTVTVDPDNSPQKDRYVILTLKPDPRYFDFTEEQRLPNPTRSGIVVNPRYSIAKLTDAKGQFEFLAGPGEYTLRVTTQRVGQMFTQRFDNANFTIGNQEELEINLHAEAATAVRLIGRVSCKDQPGKPLAQASVFIYPETAPRFGGRPAATTNENGIFQCERPRARSTVYVQSEDNSYAAVAWIDPDQTRLELQALPTEHVTGRLISAESGKAIPDEKFLYSIAALHTVNGATTPRFQFVGQAQTNLDGSFDIAGLLPGFNYLIGLSIARTTELHKRTFDVVRSVHDNLQQFGSNDLGDLAPTPADKPLTLEDRIARWFAANTNPAASITAKLRDVRLNRQNLVLVIAVPNHPDTFRLWHSRYNHESPDRMKFRQATADFAFLAVKPDRLKQAAGLPEGVAKLAASLTADDSFTLAVFSPSGELLAKVSQPELTTKGQLDLDKTSTFLHDHAPKLPDAQQLIEAAFTQAKRENKKVLLQHSETLCSPCTLLSRYFDNHRTLIEKDYVWVTIDPRFKHGREIINRYRPQPGGIPWFAVINPDGNTLVTSDSKQGNIGYPSTDTARKHFESILRQTAPHLTDKDITTLLNDLKD